MFYAVINIGSWYPNVLFSCLRQAFAESSLCKRTGYEQLANNRGTYWNIWK